MLLGISQKHNMRSGPCRLTEFCNSQCLSHFAAPFIVVRTETSITENCKFFITIVIDVRQMLCISVWCGSGNERVHSSSRTNHHPWISGRGTKRSIPEQNSHSNQLNYFFLNMCEWSFRRFTYGNLVTTSPSSRWEGLKIFSEIGNVAASHSQSELFTSTSNR